MIIVVYGSSGFEEQACAITLKKNMVVALYFTGILYRSNKCNSLIFDQSVRLLCQS